MEMLNETVVAVVSGFLVLAAWEIILRRSLKSLLLRMRKRWAWRRILPPRERVHIEKSTMSRNGKTVVRNSDVIAEAELIRRMNRIQVLREPWAVDIRNPDINLIVIGSTRHNRYAESIQREFSVNYEFVFKTFPEEPTRSILGIICRQGEEYVSSREWGLRRDDLYVDYGILFYWNARNGKKIIWIGGIHGVGTIGVLKYLMDNVNTLIDELPKADDTGTSWLFRVQYDPDHKYEENESIEMIKRVEPIGICQECSARKIEDRPKVLICDFGNVVMSYDRTRTYRALGHLLQKPYEEVGSRIEETDLRQRYEEGGLEDQEFYDHVISLFGADAKRKVSYEAFEEAWGDIFWKNDNMVYALERLAQQVKLVLLSNTNSIHFGKVKEHYGDVVSIFEGRTILSYEQKIAKPKADIYLRAKDLAGKEISFEDCLYWSQRPGNGPKPTV